MTIDEAIRRLRGFLKWRKPEPDDNFVESIALGIEALKFRQRWEDQEGEDDFPRLPGETEK